MRTWKLFIVSGFKYIYTAKRCISQQKAKITIISQTAFKVDSNSSGQEKTNQKTHKKDKI